MDASQVRAVFLEALDLDEAARQALLARQRPEVRQEVESLLANDSGSETFLSGSIERERSGQQAGSRVGPYELCELIGRGGMGAVYRASRVDGEIRREVAIKMLDRPWLDPDAVRRFRDERQILSGLTHPNIAGLIDAATTAEGRPYLVMELVRGEALDRYCETHKSSVRERLALLLPLCRAVEHAHSRLIVHRDLKPSNIMVTPDGTPKLLDFGIAKALDAGPGETRTLVLTPHFASPEQAMGEPATTATDVYGLGAVLYHLLTGRPPHDVTSSSPLEIQRAICDTEPVAPSKLRPELRGDVENIVVKAMHRDPARRYRSAGELAEDIERCLSGHAVRATPDRWTYRAGRFFARHRLAVTASAAALAAIVALLAMSIIQGRRAQQRFAQVRRLASGFLFDVEAEIRDLPGALTARQMIAATAREELGKLTLDARADPALRAEVAEASFRLARIEQGLNRSKSALEQYQRASDLLESVGADRGGPPERRRLYFRTLAAMASFANDAKGPDGGREQAARALAQARAWAAADPGEPEARQAVGEVLVAQGLLLESSGDPTSARKALEEGAALAFEFTSKDDETAYSSARTDYILAELCNTLRDPDATTRFAVRSRDTLTRLLDAKPANTRYARLRVMAVSSLANAQRLLAEKDPARERELGPLALENAASARDLALETSARDPRDKDWADLAVVMLHRWSGHLRRANRFAEAVEPLRAAGARIESLIAGDPDNARSRYLRLNNRSMLATAHIDLRQWGPARAALVEAERYAAEALAKAPGNAVARENLVGLAADLAHVEREAGNLAAARNYCRKGLELAAGMISQDPAMEKYLGSLPALRKQAAGLHIPDPTLRR